MPGSFNICKDEAFAWIEANVPRDARILDIGPGLGTWGVRLRSLGYQHIDCVEAHEPYIREFNLATIYDDIVVSDVRTVEIPSRYALAIFGDVLEHMSLADAKAVLARLLQSCDRALVSVPFMLNQGPVNGVEWERHIQNELTPESMERDYGVREWIALHPAVGVFVLPQSKIEV